MGFDWRLWDAVIVEDARKVRKLLEKGVNPNMKDERGCTPLHQAVGCRKYALAIVKLLVEHGAEVNAKCVYGVTPLHHAAGSGSLDVVEFLIEHGAEVNAKAEREWTPLHVAAAEGRIDIVKLLLEKGANPTAVSAEGKTPADIAEENNHKEVAEFIRCWLKSAERRERYNSSRLSRSCRGCSVLYGFDEVLQFTLVDVCL